MLIGEIAGLTMGEMSRELQVGLLIGAAIVMTLLISRLMPLIIQAVLTRMISPNAREIYQKIAKPYENWIGIAFALLAAEAIIFALPRYAWHPFLEIPLSLTLAVIVSWLASRIFKQFFDVYLLDAAIKVGRKVNSELLILAKFFANFFIIVAVIILFAQTHAINVVGLVASLGVGGLAVAFAAQKTLEQFLGGIVIYLDRPFVVDDYIGLPDKTFGRVESIGLRSTKIRASGKGTLVIVPNSALTQITIENFTGAKKVMSIVYLNFYREMPEEERALISQIILESTKDIFGIDARSTDVTFRELPKQDKTQAQITFFILGSGEVSMDLRRQLLDIANQNVTQQLKEYGIPFDIEEPSIYVDSPITI